MIYSDFFCLSLLLVVSSYSASFDSSSLSSKLAIPVEAKEKKKQETEINSIKYWKIILVT